MKFALTLLTLVAAAQARTIQDIDLEDITAYNYLAKYGLPLAEKIRAAEESSSRIVGGALASQNQFPYQAGLLINFEFGTGVCGGSLFQANRVLTAAHCWFDGVSQARDITVVLGSITIFSGGNRQTTSDVVMHENWTPAQISNDIAIIKIEEVPFSAAISTIPLALDNNLDFAGQNAVASGFGLTSDGGFISSTQALSFVNLQVITNEACAWTYGSWVRPSNICTLGAIGMNTCSSDSGGPLDVSNERGILQVGVVSFGAALCEAGYPSAYARVSYYADWIIQNSA